MNTFKGDSEAKEEESKSGKEQQPQSTDQPETTNQVKSKTATAKRLTRDPDVLEDFEDEDDYHRAAYYLYNIPDESNSMQDGPVYYNRSYEDDFESRAIMSPEESAQSAQTVDLMHWYYAGTGHHQSINRFEAYIHRVGRFATEAADQTSISANRDEIDNILSNTIDWINENFMLDKEEIDSKRNYIEEKLNKLGIPKFGQDLTTPMANGSITKTSKQAVNSKQPPQNKVAKTVNMKSDNDSKKAITNKSTAKNKTKPKAKMVAKPKPTEEEETTESEPSEEVEVVQSKKGDKKKPKAKSPPSKATKNKAQLPQVKPVEVQEADEETEQEPGLVLVRAEASAAEPTEIEPSQTEQETCETSAAESSANQTETVGEEVEEGTDAEAVEEEKLLSMSEKITGKEFESLNDGITGLNSGVQMLKHSYGSIIKSLVAMQNRHSKKKAAKEAQEKVAADGNSINFLTTMFTADQNELKAKSCLEATDKYDIERFLNPITRDETFKALFDEVDELNKQTEKLRTSFFDPRGAFLRDKYDSQDEVKLDRAQFNEYKLWTKKLAAIVDDIARNYNDDLLNMFRLT